MDGPLDTHLQFATQIMNKSIHGAWRNIRKKIHNKKEGKEGEDPKVWGYIRQI